MCSLRLGVASIVVLSIAASLIFVDAGLGWGKKDKGKNKDSQPVFVNNEPMPLVEVEVDDVKYAVPIYQKAKISQTRIDFDKESITAIMKKFNELLDIVFDDGGYVALVRKAPSFKRVLDGIKAGTKKLKEANPDDAQPENDGYGKNMKDMLGAIVDSQTEETLEVDELRIRSKRLLKAVEKIPAASPTGLYVDFRNMTIAENQKNETLVDHVAPIIKWIKTTNYKYALVVFKWLSSFLANFS